MDLSELFSLCCSLPYTQTGLSASYAMHRVRGVLYIFFEASSGANDWRINLNFTPKAHKQSDGTVFFVHRGFLNTWAELEPIIADEITRNRPEKIVTVGYSHGGALALLCHEYIWSALPEYRDNLYGYGFGCPRVLWGRCASRHKYRWEHFLVIRNIDDLITHLPPAVFGYRHVGKLLEIGERGKYSPIDAHRDENILRELEIYEQSSSYIPPHFSKKGSGISPLSLRLIRL